MRWIASVNVSFRRILPVLLVLLLPAAARAQYTYTTAAGSVTITGYDSSEKMTTISNKIDGLPVVCIERSAFYGCTNLLSVTIPNSVTKIRGCAFMGCGLTNVIIGSGVINLETGVFYNCDRLTGVYFLGNAPNRVGIDVFSGATNVTVYYLSGSTGWNKTFGGRPTAIWTEQSP